ncbi:MAG: hypothetical protein PHR16_03240, partial [Methylovulum sp.]|nr:hypothetical protein [Methylovulum sp.]
HESEGGPVAAHVLRSSHLCPAGICRGEAEWAPCPLCPWVICLRAASLPHPFMPCGYSGYSRQMLRCSTRQTGENTLLRNIR